MVSLSVAAFCREHRQDADCGPIEALSHRRMAGPASRLVERDQARHGPGGAACPALGDPKGYIDRSPIVDYEKPRPGKRNVIISPERFEQILRLARKQPFRDLLVATWESGCRPQESLVVEARHVDLANARWVAFTRRRSQGRAVAPSRVFNRNSPGNHGTPT